MTEKTQGNHMEVNGTVFQRIKDKLAQIEREHNVRILYACESGSRGWGFASPNSDYDVRFIYVHKPEWYVRVTPGRRDVIDQQDIPIVDDLDFEGWDLRKMLALVGKGNATLLEWLRSPIVYYADAQFLGDAWTAALETFKPERSFYHYLHMAKGNMRECGEGPQVPVKNYLYALRPTLAALWVDSGLGPAPMAFEEIVTTLSLRDMDLNSLVPDIRRLLTVKMSVNEGDLVDRLPEFDAYISRVIERLQDVKMGSSPEENLDGLDVIAATYILDTPCEMIGQGCARNFQTEEVE